MISTLRHPELEFRGHFKTISRPTGKAAEQPMSVAPGLGGRFGLAFFLEEEMTRSPVTQRQTAALCFEQQMPFWLPLNPACVAFLHMKLRISLSDSG